MLLNCIRIFLSLFVVIFMFLLNSSSTDRFPYKSTRQLTCFFFLLLMFSLCTIFRFIFSFSFSALKRSKSHCKSLKRRNHTRTLWMCVHHLSKLPYLLQSTYIIVVNFVFPLSSNELNASAVIYFKYLDRIQWEISLNRRAFPASAVRYIREI